MQNPLGSINWQQKQQNRLLQPTAMPLQSKMSPFAGPATEGVRSLFSLGWRQNQQQASSHANGSNLSILNQKPKFTAELRFPGSNIPEKQHNLGEFPAPGNLSLFGARAAATAEATHLQQEI